MTKYTQNSESRTVKSVIVKKLLGSSLDFVGAFTKEARLLHNLKHDKIVGFKAVCHNLVALMLEYVYFDISVLGREGKVSSLNDFMACPDTHDCHGIKGSFMTKVASDIACGFLICMEKGSCTEI